jgi:hypothetical protein
MGEKLTQVKKFKLFFTQFILPAPIEFVIYFFVSLLILAIISNKVLLTILADGSPVTDLPVKDVFSQRLDYLDEIFAIPILGRIILFIFWLAVGSLVYMVVWVVQNMAVEVIDDIEYAKLKGTEKRQEEYGWWGSTLAHTIFIGSSVILFLFYVIISVNVLIPTWTQLFQIGLQKIDQSGGLISVAISVFGTMTTIYLLVLFWRMFFRLRGYVYNSI